MEGWSAGFFDEAYVRVFAPTFADGEDDAAVLWAALTLQGAPFAAEGPALGGPVLLVARRPRPA